MPGRSSIAVLLPLGVVVAMTAGCSSSTTPTASAPKVVVATGSVTCTTLTGTVSFSPPLTDSGTSPGTTSITVTSSGCTAAGSDVATVTGGTGTASVSNAKDSCSSLLTPQPLTFDITWSPATIHKSVVTFSGYSIGASGFTLPASGGNVKVAGSFAGPDHGASSAATANSSEDAQALLAACGSSAGLASIPVTSGSLLLK